MCYFPKIGRPGFPRPPYQRYFWGFTLMIELFNSINELTFLFQILIF